ncbi:MAG: potassium transporter Kup [Lentisphaeria bacterium]
MSDTSNGNYRRQTALTLGALGVVFGDIGTSPLYALRECFNGLPVNPANVLGVLSLIIWSLVLIVCVKYLVFVLRADNHGEGGVLALLALALTDPRARGRRATVLMGVGILGAAMLYGDGMITPCITVLSAIEGLEVATPLFTRFVVPLSVLILVVLFAFQRAGTGQVGKVFGPVMLLWFAVLAALGLRGIVMAPEVLGAFSPWFGLRFLWTHGITGFVVMGAVFLVVTGAEALYADLGHFGAGPIRQAWLLAVFPSLLLNYLGQGALLLTTPAAVANPFYQLAPGWGLLPLVVLATLASVIASQALISGAYSITMQAIQLGYLPRQEIRHTSSHERGQIYLPAVNAFLLAGCVGLVLGFQSSSRLAAAYGIAVTVTMLVTTGLFFFVARHLWQWSRLRAGVLCAGFLAIELVFFAANAVKVMQGGWFPLAAAALVFVVMLTWRKGRGVLREKLGARLLPLNLLLDSLAREPVPRVSGTAVYLSGNPQGTPLALLHNLRHNRVLHERVILMTIVPTDEPHVPAGQRVQVEAMTHGFFRVTARYGFMETPNLSDVLIHCRAQGLDIFPHDASFFLSRETIVRGRPSAMSTWRGAVFALLSRNAQPATAFYGLPANRVVELGMQIEL